MYTSYPRVIHPVRAAGGMGDEDAREPEGAVELFGVLRLPLASRTPSGYVGVRRVAKSQKRPWQAWIKIRGDKRRRCLGSFKSPQEAAVVRARAVSCGVETLPSPRKQAARSSGATASLRAALSAHTCLLFPQSLSSLRL